MRVRLERLICWITQLLFTQTWAMPCTYRAEFDGRGVFFGRCGSTTRKKSHLRSRGAFEAAGSPFEWKGRHGL